LARLLSVRFALPHSVNTVNRYTVDSTETHQECPLLSGIMPFGVPLLTRLLLP
jgi:hypothetical protein